MSRALPGCMSPGMLKDCVSSTPTIDTPENEVMRESRASVRSPTETSVSTMEMADWRTVSCLLGRLSDDVTVLRRLALGGDAVLLAIEAGRSLGGGRFRRRIDVFRERTFEAGLVLPE